MKRKRTWKLSPGGGALFVALLIIPLVVRLLLTLIGRQTFFWTDAVGLGCAIFLGALVWLGSLRPLIREGWWRLARTWYEASFALAGLYLFYAFWIFVTGFTPVKFNSRPISRGYGFIWLAIAILPFVIGIVAYRRDKKKNE
jgi:hypothetical protein